MWHTSDIAQELNGMMRAKLPEEASRTENYTISFHVDTFPRKCRRLLSKAAKHKISPQTWYSNILVELYAREGHEQPVQQSTLTPGAHNGPK